MRNHPVSHLRYHPYLMKHYNVESFHANFNPTVRSYLARLVNSFARGLNEQKPQHLPRYVLIFDKDLLANIGFYDFGVSKVIEDMIKWIFINLNSMIEVCKADLIKKRPGALLSSSKPRLVWI